MSMAIREAWHDQFSFYICNLFCLLTLISSNILIFFPEIHKQSASSSWPNTLAFVILISIKPSIYQSIHNIRLIICQQNTYIVANHIEYIENVEYIHYVENNYNLD